jgi:hypothetical protein
MMRSIVWLLYAAALPMLASVNLSCKSKKKAQSATITKDFKTNDLGLAETQYQCFTTKAKINTSLLAIPVSASFRCRKDSIIWVSVTPGLGIEAARMLFTRDSAMVIDKINGQYLKVSYDKLGEISGYTASLSQLQKLLLGDPFLEVYDGSNFEYLPDTIKADYKTNTFILLQHFTRPAGKLAKLRLQTDQSELNLQNSDFKTVDNHLVPYAKALDLLNYDEKDKSKPLSIKIEHSRFEFVSGPLEYPFEIPGSYKKMGI